MGNAKEEIKILEKMINNSMPINSGLDYDDLQFSIVISSHVFASGMGGVFSVYGADGEWVKGNVIGFYIGDVQGWTKEYGKTVTRDMLRCAICHEMYFLKDMETDYTTRGNKRKYAGHGICYLKGEMAHINERCQTNNLKRSSAEEDNYEQVIIAPYSRTAYADAYAIFVLGISIECYYELLDNIIQYTIRTSDTVSSEYDMSLRNVQESYRDRKNEVVSCLAQMRESEDMRFLRNQLPFWADNIMGNCNEAVGDLFTPVDDNAEKEFAKALATIRGEW